MKLKMKKSFESQIENLEKIVAELENGKLSLDESVSKFEEGIKISKECNKTLEEAEKKITILINNDGETKEEEFKINEQKNKRGKKMNDFLTFVQSKYIYIPFLLWFGIQLFKLIYDLVTTKKFNFRRDYRLLVY